MLATNRHRRVASLLCLFLFVTGCGRTLPWECPTSEADVRIPIRGLWTAPNDFQAPEGSTELLTNLTSDDPGVWGPRRGFSLLQATGATITGPIDAMEFFRGYLIVHHNSTQISRWTGSAWSTYSGSYAAPALARDGRVRLTQANQSLFATTSAGIYELDSPTGTWRLTGAPPALDGTATLRRTVNETGHSDGTTTFADANGQWAYRWEWGIKNANGRLQLGAPSGRALVVNPANVVATTGNIAKLNGSTTVTVTNTTHGFATGEYVDVTLGGAETYFAAGTFQVTRVSATSFTYSDAVNNGSGITQNPGASITYGFGNGRGVDLSIPIPSGVTTDYFVQVYRSGKSASATAEPSDQLGQVYERSPTNLEITAGAMSVTDITPDGFRNGLMDISGETILAAKYQPPSAGDMALFHNCTFYAATKNHHELELQLIGLPVNSTAIAFWNDPATIASYSWVEAISLTTGSEADGVAKIYSSGSVSQNIAATARSIVRAINTHTTNTHLYAVYTSGDQEAPGKFRVYARSPTVGQFSPYVTLGSSGEHTGACFIPNLPEEDTISDISRSGTTVTVNTPIPHGYASGQQVQLLASDNVKFPTGIKTVTVTGASQFTYTEAGSAAAAEADSGFFLSRPLAEITSDVISRADRIAFSLPDQPWAVPLPNELFCDGTPTDPNVTCPTIDRIIPTRDRLYVESDAGLFQVTGYYPDFAVSTIQTPLKSLGPGFWASTGTPGRVYGLTNTGEVEAFNAADVISTPIQDQFQSVQTVLAAAGHPTYLALYGFAVAYPQDYKVITFVPTSGSNTWGDTAYVWHTRSGDWSKWDFSAQKPTAAAINPDSEKLYIGTATGAVLVERKARSVADYYDARPASIAYGGASAGVITGTTTSGMTVGEKVSDLSSGTETTIISIDSGTQITVASTTGFTGGGGNLYVSAGNIPSTVQWTRWYGKDGPNVDKEVDSGLLLFTPPSLSAPGTPEFTTVGMAVANDYNPTFDATETLTLDTVVTSQVPFQVPPDMQRGGWFRFKMTHSNPGQRYKLLGLSLNARGAGVKSGP